MRIIERHAVWMAGGLWLALCGGPASVPAQSTDGFLPDFQPPSSTSSASPDIQAGEGFIRVRDCIVSAYAEPLVAAAEAGRLMVVPEPGQSVEEGELIAKTDDTAAVHQQRVAYYAWKAEKTKLESDIEMRYAEKQAQVSEASYQEARDANLKIRNAVSPNLVRQRLFEWEASQLRIEKTLNDQEITRAGAEVKRAEYDLAEAMVERHKITSPVTGVVQERFKYAGEWVRPGDPIARLAQLNRLRVVGHLPLHDCSPAALKGSRITIEVPIKLDGEGQPVESRTIESVVTHVGVKVSDATDFEVWAEFENTPDLLFWPGVPQVVMTIEMP